ncbi:MAG: flagellar type III secretion system pore protein FliP [Rhodospirillaceae bacterium]
MGLVLAAMGLLIWVEPALAQSISVDLGDDTGSTTGRIIQMVLLLTVLSLAPGILVMATSFTRIVVVLSILRHALGTQTTPPNMVMIALALFLTMFVMGPTFQEAWTNGVSPLIEEEIDEAEAIERTVLPFRNFMLAHVRTQDLGLFLEMSGQPETQAEDAPLQALVPAFMISELRRAFEIGFLIYLPFVVIDMVIASVLMSMGMMMLPPMMLAMPFKLIFFVLVDGWYLLAGSLIQSFGTGVLPGG